MALFDANDTVLRKMEVERILAVTSLATRQATEAKVRRKRLLMGRKVRGHVSMLLFELKKSYLSGDEIVSAEIPLYFPLPDITNLLKVDYRLEEWNAAMEERLQGMFEPELTKRLDADFVLKFTPSYWITTPDEFGSLYRDPTIRLTLSGE